ncbi:MAG: LexA family protein [Pyrinomonadaceae bacterium]
MPLALSMISAGPAAEAVEDYSLLDINELITNGREGFVAFEVTGNSMVENILPGYMIFVDAWAEPRNGDIIAAAVDDAICVKIFSNRANGLYLVSANRDYPPQEITAKDNFRIVGVVKGHLAVYR